MELFSLLGKLAKLTDDEKYLNEWTNILTEAYSEFGEALPVEGLAEAIAPIDVLQQYVREAVRQETGEFAVVLIEQFANLIDFLQKNMPQNVFLDSRVLVSELAPGINTYLGKVYNNEMRGNTR